MTPTAEVDVVVIGGGATGAGVLRDLAMRGLRATLVERGDFASGTSGRYHGLLHSGARYIESDPLSARHCIEENAVLRRIAPGTIEHWLRDDYYHDEEKFIYAIADAMHEEYKAIADAGISAPPSNRQT